MLHAAHRVIYASIITIYIHRYTATDTDTNTCGETGTDTRTSSAHVCAIHSYILVADRQQKLLIFNSISAQLASSSSNGFPKRYLRYLPISLPHSFKRALIYVLFCRRCCLCWHIKLSRTRPPLGQK